MDTVDTLRGEVEPHEVWIWAMAWFSQPPFDRARRRRQEVLVQAIKEAIGDVPLEGLHERYLEGKWATKLARQTFPETWPSLGVNCCISTAFGLRWVEMMVGRRIDATKPLPPWTSEWAVLP